MAFNSPVVGDTITHTDITQFVNNWSGVAGFGVAFENIQVNETSKYAGDFQNLDTTNSYGLRVRDSSSNALFTAVLAGCTLSKTTTLSRGTITTDLKVLDASATWNAAGVTFTAMKLNVTDTASAAASLLLDLQVGGTSKVNVTKGGILFLGDTANANMTVGLTINQGANDDQAFALKSSDVAHGITDVTETDTFGFLRKVADADGGLVIRGLNEITEAILIHGIGVTDNTAKTTAARAYTELWASKKSGTSTTNPGADANIVAFILADGTTRFIFDAEGTMHSIGASYSDQIGNGKWFINDTANANVTIGLTINQSTATNQILAFKQSDVAHGITTYAETDTYGYIESSLGEGGGLRLVGLSETTTAMSLAGYASSADATKSISALGSIQLTAATKSGTTVGAQSANSNLVVIKDSASVRFILDADGDSHQDVGTAWTNFDDLDDVALLTGLSVGVSKEADPIRQNFAGFLEENREVLTRLKLVTFNEDQHHFVNMSKLTMLLVGAVRQTAARLQLAEQKLSLLPGGNA